MGKRDVHGDHGSGFAASGPLRLLKRLQTPVPFDLGLNVGRQARNRILPGAEVGQRERTAEERDVGEVASHLGHGFHRQGAGVPVGVVSGDALRCLSIQAVLDEAVAELGIEPHLQVADAIPQEGVVPKVAKLVDRLLGGKTAALAEHADAAADQLRRP